LDFRARFPSSMSASDFRLEFPWHRSCGVFAGPISKEVVAMATIEQSIDVTVPVRTVYNQWTQFEEFPRFMEGVLEVRQLDDKRLHWKAEIAGKEKAWDAEITEQIPDERIAWRSRGGAWNAGVVTFHRLGDS